MRITSVELQPEGSSDVCVLSFRDPQRANPFNVKSITGLDAEEIFPRFYGYSSELSYYEMMIQKREITILIQLNPDFSEYQSYSDLRDALYRYISASRTGLIYINFKDGTDVKAFLTGFVTKMEASHFTSTPEVQMTIKCKQGLLKAPLPISVPVGELNTDLAVVTDNLSTAPHGLSFEVKVLDTIDQFTIKDPDDVWSFTVSYAFPFLADDVIFISSEHNNKHAYFERPGVGFPIHIGYSITPESFWPMIFPGDNQFEILEPTKFDWQAISYTPTYWGV